MYSPGCDYLVIEICMRKCQLFAQIQIGKFHGFNFIPGTVCLPLFGHLLFLLLLLLLLLFPLSQVTSTTTTISPLAAGAPDECH